jgi:hypothetical protein
MTSQCRSAAVARNFIGVCSDFRHFTADECVSRNEFGAPTREALATIARAFFVLRRFGSRAEVSRVRRDVQSSVDPSWPLLPPAPITQI